MISSPYSLEAAQHLLSFSQSCKIGSGDITYSDLIRFASENFSEVLLATGASNQNEVDAAISWVKDQSKLILMQCNTNYTSSHKDLIYQQLSVLNTWSKRYPRVTLGISCHMKNDIGVLAAIALGARVVEKHFTDDSNRSGPDHGFALEPPEFANMVQRGNEILAVCGSDLEKNVQPNELETRILQRRSIHASRDLEKGDRLVASDCTFLRPCPEDGIVPCRLDTLLGKVINRPVSKGTMLEYCYFDDI